jgi:hypothetical protein
MANTTTTDRSQGALAATTDRTGRRVPSEGAETYTEVAPRETHRITPSGSVPRTGR